MLDIHYVDKRIRERLAASPSQTFSTRELADYLALTQGQDKPDQATFKSLTTLAHFAPYARRGPLKSFMGKASYPWLWKHDPSGAPTPEPARPVSLAERVNTLETALATLSEAVREYAYERNTSGDDYSGRYKDLLAALEKIPYGE